MDTCAMSMGARREGAPVWVENSCSRLRKCGLIGLKEREREEGEINYFCQVKHDEGRRGEMIKSIFAIPIHHS